MLKSQYILVGIAIALVVTLFYLPKSVVNTKKSEVKEQKKASPSAADDHSVEDMHETKADSKQSAKLAQWKKSFLASSTSKEQGVWLDSLSNLFKVLNRYDSVAHYTEVFAQKFASAENNLRAGNAYYEAYGFAMEDGKRMDFAKKTQNYFEEILAKNPLQYEIQVKLGMTYMSSENPMKGIQTIKDVLQKEPKNTFALLHLGLLSMKIGKYDKASEHFDNLLTINPTDWQAQFYRAVSLLELGKKEEAKKGFELVKANEKDPNMLLAVQKYLEELK
ncbi:MAG: hypothetical protein EAZ97_14225 [Bacteroidetes bacterium]|nr:MAG: hypothetical protein EAZ97_14225 [Bacteroidota bacterium]